MVIAPDTIVGAGAVVLFGGLWNRLFGADTAGKECVCKCPRTDLRPVVKAISESHDADYCPAVDLTPVVDALQSLAGSPGVAYWLVCLGVLAAFVLGITVGCFGSVLYLSCRWTRSADPAQPATAPRPTPSNPISSSARAIGNVRHLVSE